MQNIEQNNLPINQFLRDVNIRTSPNQGEISRGSAVSGAFNEILEIFNPRPLPTSQEDRVSREPSPDFFKKNTPESSNFKEFSSRDSSVKDSHSQDSDKNSEIKKDDNYTEGRESSSPSSSKNSEKNSFENEDIESKTESVANKGEETGLKNVGEKVSSIDSDNPEDSKNDESVEDLIDAIKEFMSREIEGDKSLDLKKIQDLLKNNGLDFDLLSEKLSQFLESSQQVPELTQNLKVFFDELTNNINAFSTGQVSSEEFFTGLVSSFQSLDKQISSLKDSFNTLDFKNLIENLNSATETIKSIKTAINSESDLRQIQKSEAFHNRIADSLDNTPRVVIDNKDFVAPIIEKKSQNNSNITNQVSTPAPLNQEFLVTQELSKSLPVNQNNAPVENVEKLNTLKPETSSNLGNQSRSDSSNLFNTTSDKNNPDLKPNNLIDKKPSSFQSYLSKTFESEKQVLDRIMTQIKLKLTAETREVQFNLSPPDLGSVKVNLQEQNGQLSARIVVDSHAIKDIVENNLNQLKTSLSEGMKIDKVEVEVKDQQLSDRQKFELSNQQQNGNKGKQKNLSQDFDFYRYTNDNNDDLHDSYRISVPVPGGIQINNNGRLSIDLIG